MNLQTKIAKLYRTAQELLHLGENGEPIYADRFSKLNVDVYRQCEALIAEHGSSVEEEASLCVALLAGYKVTFLNYGDKDEKIQSLLDRSWNILDQLSDSWLKCRLLVVCYAEVYDQELAEKAHAIIRCWEGRELTAEETDVIIDLRHLEENHYPWNNIEE